MHLNSGGDVLAQIISKCPKCCGKLTIILGQTVYNHKINYYEEHLCADCGYALEVDSDETPANSRILILEEQGTWEIVCLEKGTTLLKLLKEIFNYSIKQLAELKTQDTISFSGTLAEMNHLKNIFESHNFQVDMKRIT
jgi:hypothetical protein